MRPARIPRMPKLRSLTVHCQYAMTTRDAAYLYKWVRRAITYAPLEFLRLVCEHQPSGAAPSFDPLLEHLIARHARRLRILDLREFLVGWRALRRLCDSCLELEDLFVTVSPATLVSTCDDPARFSMCVLKHPFRDARRTTCRSIRGRSSACVDSASTRGMAGAEASLPRKPRQGLWSSRPTCGVLWSTVIVSRSVEDPHFSRSPPLSTELCFRGWQGGWTADASGTVAYTVKQVDTAVRLFSWEKGCLDGTRRPTAMTLLD